MNKVSTSSSDAGTYDIFAAHWPNASEEEGKPLNDATKYVASRSRPKLDGGLSVLIEGDTPEAIAALKKNEDGPELQEHGSRQPDPDPHALRPG